MLFSTAYSSAGQLRNDGSTTFTRASDEGPAAVTQCQIGPRQPSTSPTASAPGRPAPAPRAPPPAPSALSSRGPLRGRSVFLRADRSASINVYCESVLNLL